MSKRILTRIKQKHEVESDWDKATSFVPYDGELIVYDADTTHPYPRFKVGDGSTTVVNLPFSDAEYCHLDDIEAVSADLTGHTTNNAIHITSTERTNWNAAHTHSLAAHAPSNAQANQNAFSNVKVGSTTIAADTTTDTIELVGSNVTLTPDATNDKVTIGITKANVTAALGYTPPTTDSNSYHTTGSWNGLTYTATAVGGAGELKFTVPTGTSSTTVAAGNHTHSYIPTSQKGTASGVAELDSNGKVPTSQLPSFVDDVIEGTYVSSTSFKNTSGTALTGETGKIYVDTSTNKTYRWSGSAFTEISASLALGETSSTAYRGDRGKTAYEHSQATHARTDATATAASSTNGNIKINGTETTVYTHPTSHAASMITGLATVATSGSYNDLSNKPSIPTVNNATLTIQKNGTNVATFTANSSTNQTANITVPTGAAADKGVDTSISASSTSTNLPTSKAVAAFVEGKGYKTTDNNTTYTFATGDSNGQIKVTPSGGSAQNVSVKGLGSAAYTASTAYATAAQGTKADNALPKSGGTMTGEITIGQGDGKGIQLGTDGRINATTSTGTNTATVCGISGTSCLIGHSGFGLTLRGSGTRPTYNGANMALLSDVEGRAPAYQYSTTDLTAGSSSLATGTLYFVYE